jgi:hypothetical protein
MLLLFFRDKEYFAEKKSKNYITFEKDEIVEHFTKMDIRKLKGKKNL